MLWAPARGDEQGSQGLHNWFEFVVCADISLRRRAANQETQGNDGEDVAFSSLYILASKVAPRGVDNGSIRTSSSAD